MRHSAGVCGQEERCENEKHLALWDEEDLVLIELSLVS